MKSALKLVVLGVGGLALAVALSLGAFALAGHSLSEPGTAVQIPAAAGTKTPGPEKSHSADHTSGPTRTSAPTPTETETPEDSATPSSGDHGGGDGGEPGGGDDGGGGGGGDDSDD